MTLGKSKPGSGQKRYFIKNEVGTVLAWFDSLDVAACVLRYLKGAPLPVRDAERAHAALQEFEAWEEGDNE